MIQKLVLLGATGNLAGRYLLPALAALRVANRLPDDFEVVGAARQGLDDETFQYTAAVRLEAARRRCARRSARPSYVPCATGEPR